MTPRPEDLPADLPQDPVSTYCPPSLAPPRPAGESSPAIVPALPSWTVANAPKLASAPEIPGGGGRDDCSLGELGRGRRPFGARNPRRRGAQRLFPRRTWARAKALTLRSREPLRRRRAAGRRTRVPRPRQAPALPQALSMSSAAKSLRAAWARFGRRAKRPWAGAWWL
jgi:hypothetical protein